MTAPMLPKLIDCKGIMDELGVKRSVAEAYMRKLDKVTVPDNRKIFVKRADLERLLAEHTVAA